MIFGAAFLYTLGDWAAREKEKERGERVKENH